MRNLACSFKCGEDSLDLWEDVDHNLGVTLENILTMQSAVIWFNWYRSRACIVFNTYSKINRHISSELYFTVSAI